jgi:hypothetical protein
LTDELPTPLQLVNEMDRVLHFGRKGTQVIHELREAFLAAKLAYTKAALYHKSALTCSQAAKEDSAQLEHFDLYTVMAQAEVALIYAKEKRDDLERELSALQSKSRLVIKEMEMSR